MHHTNNIQDVTTKKNTKSETSFTTSPHLAEEELSRIASEARKISTKSETSFTASPPEKVFFNPEEIFYLTTNGAYYVNKGSYYQVHQRIRPVQSGITRWLERTGSPHNDFKDLLTSHREDIELDRAVDWAGSLAGHKMGIMKQGERSHLIIDEAKLYEPKQGTFPRLQSIIDQAFPDKDARAVFLGWLSDGIYAVQAGIHQPAPMMVLAGEANSGKSLLAYITCLLLGGRSGDPMTAWTGTLPWNDDLLGNEFLLIDDSDASTDTRSRRKLGSNFKAAIYAKDVKINTRGKTSIDVRPVWRVMICCNEEPENLSIIPPLDGDIRDKISLLRVAKIQTPMPARTVDEKEAFQKAIRAELPAFAYFLKELETPPHLQDSRAGVKAWHAPELLAALKEISAEGKLEEIITSCIEVGFLDCNHPYTAAELHNILADPDSPVSAAARSQLGRHSSVCGTLLSKLHKQGSPIISTRSEGRSRSIHYTFKSSR